ncbi:MAG: hypothetical protein AAGC74_09995 [Verrucomicrobiota bacterium]
MKVVLLHSEKRGFSLIVTVTLLVLLSLLSVGLLSLSTTTLRSAGQSEAQLIARANARLALQTAVGELQRTMGPDTRISANAEILSDSQRVDGAYEKVAGVWNAWKQDPYGVGNYGARKTGTPVNDEGSGGAAEIPRGGFYRWLVSSEDPLDAEDVDFVQSRPGANSIVMYPEIQGSQAEEVRVPTVAVSDGLEVTGRYGWAVFDEAQKAALNAVAVKRSNSSVSSTYSELDRIALQEDLSWSNANELGGIERVDSGDRGKLISQDSIELASVDNAERYAHDLTAFSSGVLSNVVDGGLKWDLSLLFEDEDLPTPFTGKHRYIYSIGDDNSNTGDPIVEAPDRGTHRYPLPSPDPTWELLKNYYRVPLDYLEGSASNPVIPFRMNAARSDEENSFAYRTINNQPNPAYHDDVKLAPVISKAQFIFSMAFGHSNDLWHRPNNGAYRGTWPNDIYRGSPQQPGASPWKSAANMVIDPFITLWNPYDVPMDVSPFYVYLYRVPLSFRFETDNPSWRIIQEGSDDEGWRDFVLFSHYTQATNQSSGEHAPMGIPLEIRGTNGGSVRLLPGEHRVFGPVNNTSFWKLVSARNGNMGDINKDDILQLEPGYIPPTTRGAPKTGISTAWLAPTRRGLKVSDFQNGRGGEYFGYPQYSWQGRRQGWWPVSSIFMGVGDKLTISVKASDEDAGSFDTLGDKPVDFYVRYGSWVNVNRGGRMIAAREQEHNPDFGSIEFNYGNEIDEVFDELDGRGESDIPNFPFNPAELVQGNDGDRRNGIYDRKRPFLVATLHLKSLIPDKMSYHTKQFYGKSWLYSNPNSINSAAGMGNEGDLVSLGAEQYQFSYEPLFGEWGGEVPEIEPDTNRGYGGPSPTPEGGRNFMPFSSVPRRLPTSLGQFRHAPLNQSGQHPLQSHIVGNSFAHPIMNATQVINRTTRRIDHSFLANNALFDRTFLSSAENSRDFGDFVEGNFELKNSRFRVELSGRSDESGVWSTNDAENYRKSASLMMLEGQFNVNSTSVLAWTAFLSGFFGESVPQLKSLTDGQLGRQGVGSGSELFSRYLVPIEQGLGRGLEGIGTDPGGAWEGQRLLTALEISELAERIVEQVKLRGPFQSLGEFVNRRAEMGPLGLKGCLQAALDDDDGEGIGGNSLNEDVLGSVGISLRGNLENTTAYENPEAAKGFTLEGTPGHLLQGDLLNSIAPYISVRSYTFKVRAYGSSTDKNGRVLAEAWCEAVVQRSLDYVDATNRPEEFLDGDGNFQLTDTNRNFGRKFRVVSFRWLPNSEVRNG